MTVLSTSNAPLGEIAPSALAEVAERMGDVLFRCSVGSETALRYASAGIARLTGYTPGELDASAELASSYFAADTFVAASDGTSASMRLTRWTRKDGSQLWVELRTWPLHDSNAATIGLEGIARDVTDRVRVEERLRRSEEAVRTMLDCAPSAVVVHRDGRIMHVNQQFCAVVRRTQAELAGLPMLDLIPEESRGAVEAAVRRILSGGGAPTFHELRMLRSDGSTLPVEGNLVPIAFQGQRTLMSVVRDLTEKRELQSRLQLADRMASVGTLAAGVAHEVNNPLAFVMVNQAFVSDQLDRVARRLSPVDAAELQFDEVRQALSEAREGAQRVREIVSELKTFSRADDEKRGPVNVGRVVETCVNIASNEIRHRARLVKDWGCEGIVDANEARLGQVFLNLLVNAAQSIGEGRADQNEVRVTVRPEGDGWMAVVVEDTGCGIPASALPRIFDPFFTTKPVGVGTGLGLSICHSIVTAVGGTIQVESTEGRGSRFTVLLPLRVAASAKAAPPPEAKEPAAPRARILVIDDEVAVGTALRRVLRREYDVEHVLSARDALDRIRREPYDAMLCDLMMPEMTGMEFHAELVRTLPGEVAKIIFFTGGAFTDGARTFLERVPNLRLEKPFETAQIESALQEVIGGIGRVV